MVPGPSAARGRRAPRPHYGRKRRIAGGYVFVWLPGHPLALAYGYVAEHRLVAWDAGILTERSQQVHHVNENKQDNRIENLVVMDAAEHTRLHHPPQGGIGAEYRRRRAELGDRACEVCGQDITALRIDAVVCGNNCRITRWKRAGRKT